MTKKEIISMFKGIRKDLRVAYLSYRKEKNTNAFSEELNRLGLELVRLAQSIKGEEEVVEE